MVARRRRQVVLPAPLTPSSPKICPGSQRKFTWSTARISPRFLSRKSLVSWRVSITRHWLVRAEDARAGAHWQARLDGCLREGPARRAGQPSAAGGRLPFARSRLPLLPPPLFASVRISHFKHSP